MKRLAKKFGVLIVLISGLIIVPTIVHATPDNPPDDVQDVPFDGGVSLLVAAGIGYGLKKAYDRKKEEKNAEVIEK